MKLLNYYKKEDFGVEHIFTILKGKRRSFLQLSLDWSEFPGNPYLQIGIGNNRLIDILFWCWKFGFVLSLFDFTWGGWDEETDDK
jgi:hypothetical protein